MGDALQPDLPSGFNLDDFLAQPLVARVATSGPTIRPIWYLWEDGCFWWLTGGWSRLSAILERDPRVALVVDTCDLETGCVIKVSAHGHAALTDFDAARAKRKLVRYLGPEIERWDERFRSATFNDPATRFVRLRPQAVRARDLSFEISPRE